MFFVLRSVLINEVVISILITDFDWAIGNRLEAAFSYLGVPIIFVFFQNCSMA
ncbi:hypothetical protein N752_11990 [Desulforamulus aquiferis]|nr:hypothetical protein N752_11990 [Desulforamulus aquiferis]